MNLKKKTSSTSFDLTAHLTNIKLKFALPRYETVGPWGHTPGSAPAEAWLWCSLFALFALKKIDIDYDPHAHPHFTPAVLLVAIQKIV